MPKRILVVEDDTSIRELLVELLESEGYSVASAVNGLEGLKYLQTETSPDLILIDLMMPVMDGYELTRRIRSDEAATSAPYPLPIVALTANAFESDREQCMRAGMDDFIAKPITSERLVAIVDDLLLR